MFSFGSICRGLVTIIFRFISRPWETNNELCLLQRHCQNIAFLAKYLILSTREIQINSMKENETAGANGREKSRPKDTKIFAKIATIGTRTFRYDRL